MLRTPLRSSQLAATLARASRSKPAQPFAPPAARLQRVRCAAMTASAMTTATARRFAFLSRCVAPAPFLLVRTGGGASSFATSAAGVQVADGDVCSVFYTLTIKDGEQVDSNVGKSAMEVKLGTGGVIPGCAA